MLLRLSVARAYTRFFSLCALCVPWTRVFVVDKRYIFIILFAMFVLCCCYRWHSLIVVGVRTATTFRRILTFSKRSDKKISRYICWLKFSYSSFVILFANRQKMLIRHLYLQCDCCVCLSRSGASYRRQSECQADRYLNVFRLNFIWHPRKVYCVILCAVLL